MTKNGPIKKRTTKSLTAFSPSALANLEANERQRVTVPEWKDNWSKLSTVLDPTRLNQRLAEEYRHGQWFPTPNELRSVWVDWVDGTICPTAFVTILMPNVAVSESPRRDQQHRDPEFYIRLLTKRAEHMLWGRSTRHIRFQDDRCLWIGVQEIEIDRIGAEMGCTFLHYHFLLRLPTRPMRGVDAGVLPVNQRLAAVQKALLHASRLTPRAFATGGSLDELRIENDLSIADIQVKPYERRHANYVFKKLERAGTLTGLNAHTLAAAGLVILPNRLRPLDSRITSHPHQQEKMPDEHHTNEEDRASHPHRAIHGSVSSAATTSVL